MHLNRERAPGGKKLDQDRRCRDIEVVGQMFSGEGTCGVDER